MAREILTDEQVELGIEMLKNSEYVALAKAELANKYKRRQYLYQLRSLEKRGKYLAAQGYDITDFDPRAFAPRDEEEPEGSE